MARCRGAAAPETPRKPYEYAQIPLAVRPPMSNPTAHPAKTTGTSKRGGLSAGASAKAGKRGKVRSKPKGRAVDPKALEEVRALLGDAPRRRDLLIEHLHKIQDRYHCLSAAHVVALASE